MASNSLGGECIFPLDNGGVLCFVCCKLARLGDDVFSLALKTPLIAPITDNKLVLNSDRRNLCDVAIYNCCSKSVIVQQNHIIVAVVQMLHNTFSMKGHPLWVSWE